MKILKSFVIVWAMVLILIGGNQTFAALAPITDHANILKENEKKQIEQEIQNVTNTEGVTFTIVTVPSLEGKDVSVYAKELFKNENLQENNVLFLLAMKERKSYLQTAETGEWKEHFASYGGFTKYLEEYFVPPAKEGGYAAGIVGLVQHVNEVKTASVNNAADAEHFTNSVASFGGAVLDMLKIAGLLLVGIVVLIGGFLSGKKLRTKNKTKNELLIKQTAMKKEVDDLIHKTKEAQKFLLEQNELKGESFEYLVFGKRLCTELLTELTPIQEELSKKITFRNMNDIKVAIQEFASNKQEFQNEYKRMNKEKSTLENAMDSFSRSKQRLTSEIAMVEPLRESITSRTGFSLKSVQEKIDTMKQSISVSDESFDPVTKERKFNSFLQILSTVSKKLHDFDSIRPVRQEMEKVFIHMQSSVSEYMQKEELRNEDFPTKHVETVQNLLSVLQSQLEDGEFEELKQTKEKIERLCKDAFSTVKQLVAFREENKSVFVELENTLGSTVSSVTLEQVLQKANQFFITKQIQDMESAFEKEQNLRKEIEKLIVEAKMLQEEKQYGECHTLLHKAKVKAIDLVHFHEIWKDGVSRLEQEKQDFGNVISQYEHRVKKATTEAGSYVRTVSALEYEKNRASQIVQEVRNEWRANPCNLDEVSRLLHRAKDAVSTFESNVSHFMKEKARAERRMREIESKYRSTYNRTSGKISSRYSSSYRSDNLEQMLAAGMFAQMFSEMDSVERNISSMEREYQSALDDERRSSSSNIYGNSDNSPYSSPDTSSPSGGGADF